MRAAVSSEKLALDVHVLGVDRSRGRNLVLGQPLRVVEVGPFVLGEDLGGLGERPQRPVVLEHPRVDVLAGEERRVVPQLVGEDALGRPAGRDARGVAGLVDHRVDRVALERHRRLHVVQERG